MVLFLQEHFKTAIFHQRRAVPVHKHTPVWEKVLTIENVTAILIAHRICLLNLWALKHWALFAVQRFPSGTGTAQALTGERECLGWVRAWTYWAHNINDRSQSSLVLGVVEPRLFTDQCPQLVQVDSGTELLVSLQVIVSHAYFPKVARVTVEETHSTLDHIFNSSWTSRTLTLKQASYDIKVFKMSHYTFFHINICRI